MTTGLTPVIDEPTIGDAWIAVARRIMEGGTAGTYDGLAIREVLMTTIIVRTPETSDAIIDRFANPERLAWMRANFEDFSAVPELGGADSYATRLRNYAGAGLDQLRWVSERLRSDLLSRSTAITTLQPLTDSTYIPCVSLLDFFIHDDALQLVVYAHSIDFGAKGYGNLLELAAIQCRVAEALERTVGSLTMIIKSAHIYDSDGAYVTSVLGAVSE